MILSNQYWEKKSPKEYLGRDFNVEATMQLQYGYAAAQQQDLDESREDEFAEGIRLYTIQLNRTRRRLDILRMFAKALRMKRYGRYELLSDAQIKAVMLAFWKGGVGGNLSMSIDLPTFIKSAKDLLSFALEFFYPGGDVRRRAEFYESQCRNRLVIEGHGCYHAGAAEVVVPAGKSVHFYCVHGDPLLEDYGHLSGAFSVAGTITVPSEVRYGGERVRNYFLGFPAGLTTDASGKGGLDALYINRNPKEWIPLSKIFRDPKARTATELHWSACRVAAPDDAKLKPGPVLVYDVVKKKGAAKVDYGSKVLELKPVT